MYRQNHKEIDIDAEIDHLLWMNVYVEVPEFLDEEIEERIEDAFIPDNIETM